MKTLAQFSVVSVDTARGDCLLGRSQLGDRVFDEASDLGLDYREDDVANRKPLGRVDCHLFPGKDPNELFTDGAGDKCIAVVYDRVVCVVSRKHLIVCPRYEFKELDARETTAPLRHDALPQERAVKVALSLGLDVVGSVVDLEAIE